MSHSKLHFNRVKKSPNIIVKKSNEMLSETLKHSDALKFLSETTRTTKALVAQFALRAKYSVGSATKASKWLQ